MMLEKEDWQEPGCPFEPQAEAKPAASDYGTAGIQNVIEELDRLLAMDATEEAGVFLEQKLLEYEENGDWSGQITILNEMMGFYRNTGETEKGLESVRKGMSLIASHSLGETVSGGTTYLNGATTLKAFGKTKEAMPYYEQAFRAYGNHLDRGDYRFGGLFNNMALAHEDMGEYEKAEAYYHKAMEIMERLKPGSILELAVTWVNLACLYEKWGRTEKTNDCLMKAVDYFHMPQVPRDAYYAFNCRKCAGTFGHFGYFRIRRELEEAAERIYGEAGKRERD